jgi:hypothetical protein
MKLRHLLWICVGVGLLTLLAVAAWARAYVAGQAAFTSNGNLISGWYWVRSAGQSATWTIDAAPFQAAKSGSVYLNFNPLVTNGVNGGSGYSAICKVTVVGRTTGTYSITATNPYRPIDPANSGGIGYQCYGHSGVLPTTLWKGAKTLKITVAYPFGTSRHVAVNKDCLYIGYSK